MAELLLEIGLEEIPARMIAAAEAELARRVEAALTRERLLGSAVAVSSYSTPRRLAVRVTGVLAQQLDTQEQLTGPFLEGSLPRRAARSGGPSLRQESRRPSQCSRKDHHAQRRIRRGHHAAARAQRSSRFWSDR